MVRKQFQPEVYRIVIKGQLDQAWSSWFEGMDVTIGEDGKTILTGTLADQTALHGVLIKIRDLGLPLLSLTHLGADIEPGNTDEKTG